MAKQMKNEEPMIEPIETVIGPVDNLEEKPRIPVIRKRKETDDKVVSTMDESPADFKSMVVTTIGPNETVKRRKKCKKGHRRNKKTKRCRKKKTSVKKI